MHDRDEDAGLMIWVQSKYFHCRTKRQMWTRRCGAGAFSMVGILIRLLGSAHSNSNYKCMLNYRIVHSVTLFASAFYYRRIQMCKRKHYCSNIGINPNFIVGVHQHLIDFIRSSILVLGGYGWYYLGNRCWCRWSCSIPSWWPLMTAMMKSDRWGRMMILGIGQQLTMGTGIENAVGKPLTG